MKEKLDAVVVKMLDAAVVDSRAIFETWAGTRSVPDEPVDSLQVRLYRWQETNFGLQPDNNIVLGIIEEMGEMFASRDEADAVDGTGDVLVYAGNICTNNRLAIRPLLHLAADLAIHWAGLESEETLLADPVTRAGFLAHTTLKHVQNIRGMGDPDTYRRQLVFNIAACIARTLLELDRLYDFEPQLTGAERLATIYSRVGEYVMTRNWKANAVTGQASA